MHKKTVTALLFLCFLFLLTTRAQNVCSQNDIYPLASGIFIMSPSNTTYNSNSMLLNTSINVATETKIHVSMTYSLDGTENKSLSTKTYTRGNSFLKQIIGSTNLSDVSNGPHNITVYAKYTITNQLTSNENSTVHFSVNTKTEQQIPEFHSQNILMLAFGVTFVALLCKPKISKLFFKGSHVHTAY